MGIITRGSFPKSLTPGVKGFFGLAYKEYDKGQQWKKIFDVQSSEQSYEEIVALSGMGIASLKPETSGINYGSMKQSYVSKFVHLTYATGFIISYEAIKDNVYAKLAQQRATNLAFSMNQTRELVAANVINRATTAGYTIGDGQTLASANHPLDTGGVLSNQPSVAADLSELALEQACIDIGKWVDQAGNKISINPTGLLVPVDLQFDAYRITKTPYQPGSANNDVNAINAMGKFPRGIIVNNYLSDSDAWSVLTDCPDGLVAFERETPNIDNDNEFDTRNAKFAGFMRYSFGAADPRGIYHSAGA